MILKMILGKGARGLLSYISNPEKTGSARPFFSNMAGTTPREIAAEAAALRRLRPNLSRAVGHLVLSADPLDGALSESEWQEAITTALEAHGAEQAAFAAYRHTDTDHHHTHVFF